MDGILGAQVVETIVWMLTEHRVERRELEFGLFDIVVPPCQGSPSLKTTPHYRESGVGLRVTGKFAVEI